MAINKAIADFTATTPVSGDKLLIQRDQTYYSVTTDDLGAGIFKTTATLTALQLQSLNNTPIEVLAGQGVNTYINFISAMAFRNGSAFTATDPILKLVWTGSTTERFSTSSTFLTDSANTNVSQMTEKSVGNRVFNNIGLTAYLTNNVTTATGPVTIEIIYRISTFS